MKFIIAVFFLSSIIIFPNEIFGQEKEKKNIDGGTEPFNPYENLVWKMAPWKQGQKKLNFIAKDLNGKITKNGKINFPKSLKKGLYVFVIQRETNQNSKLKKMEFTILEEPTHSYCVLPLIASGSLESMPCEDTQMVCAGVLIANNFIDDFEEIKSNFPKIKLLDSIPSIRIKIK